MATGLLGDNLVFLISQPRTGSTLLQKTLGAHPNVLTASEPWLMLHPLYALRTLGFEAEYDEQHAGNALRLFIDGLPDGMNDYFEGLRRMYGHLYDRALTDSACRLFLDKTPRYYSIIPELYRVFPRAHFIFLLRNPLGVLNSILKTWIKSDYFNLHIYMRDLVKAPDLILQGIDLLGSSATVVRYESLVKEPENEVESLCERLGIEFTPQMIEYGEHQPRRFEYGDQQNVDLHKRPVPQFSEQWVTTLDHPQVFRLQQDYLRALGQDTVQRMGYEYESLERTLSEHRPSWARLVATLPLSMLLADHEKSGGWESGAVRLTRSLQRRGVGPTAVAVVKEILRDLGMSGKVTR